MKPFYLLISLTGFFLIFSLNILYAQDSTKTDNEKETIEHNQRFIDNDGDGYNDNAPDHDGDGIPNGLDPDWQKLKKRQRNRQRFVDLDGDGINDNIQTEQGSENNENQNPNKERKGSSLDKKSAEGPYRQQKKQGVKP
jgi:hypothetical protein